MTDRKMGFRFAILILMTLFVLNCGKKYGDGLFAEIETSKGMIVVQLDYEKAPMTTANFVGLAEGTINNSAREPGEPYYDGLTFHRVEPDFVIQGGDPAGDGSGGPGYEFPNEIHPDLKHDGPGVLAMANGGPNTNGSQFYITYKDLPNLDGRYTVFGRVWSGGEEEKNTSMDVVNSIEQNDRIISVKVIRGGKAARGFASDEAAFRGMITSSEKKILAEIEERRKKEMEMINNKWPEALTTSSGLKYIILEEGLGPSPVKGNMVQVHYTVTFVDGEKLDSSHDRGQPYQFAVGEGNVIPGFDEGVMAMKKGEKRILIVPAELAYGEKGSGNIPPQSPLVFELELLSFE